MRTSSFDTTYGIYCRLCDVIIQLKHIKNVARLPTVGISTADYEELLNIIYNWDNKLRLIVETRRNENRTRDDLIPEKPTSLEIITGDSNNNEGEG